jgi:SAM-dependent MidA family methyltransferase
VNAAPPAPDPAGEPALLAAIHREIRERGALPFSRFQELALYHPRWGYYTRRAAIGKEGADFWTAPEMEPVFGELVSAQILEMFDLLDQPPDFQVVEIGGGTGRLAQSILTAWRTRDALLYRPGVYRMVETSPVLLRRQADLLAGHGKIVTWDEPSAGAAAPAGPGAILMNEVLDALPVDRAVRLGDDLREIRVGLDGGKLVEVRLPARDEVRHEVERRVPGGAGGLAEGQEVEIRPSLKPFMKRTLGCIQRGYVLAIDYGMRAAELYRPSRRRGTLLAYHRHQANENLLQRVGLQDLTAHVDWTAVGDLAGESGFRELGLTTQMRFLLAMGISERIEALEEADMEEPERIHRRLSMASLIRPGGMGEMFKVWAGSRRAPEGIRGMLDPLTGGAGTRSGGPA